VVQAPLPKPLPNPKPSIDLDQAVDDVLSHATDDHMLVDRLETIRSAIKHVEKFGDNEDSIHALVDLMVLTPIALLGKNTGLAFNINRNGADHTGATLRSLRPDVLLWLPSGVLAFKGEDKAEERHLSLAKMELLTKLNSFTDAFFGRVPYQICYAAAGFFLEFMAIDRNPGGKPRLFSLAPAVNLSQIRGRSLCVRYAVNIARVLISLQATYPEGSVCNLGQTIKSQSSDVTIFGDFVIKRTKVYTNEDVLKELYTAIARSRPRFMISLTIDPKFTSGGSLTLRISPVGFCGKRPGSLEEMKHAGRSVLSALEWLHRHHWVHRDVRPSNIMFANGEWYLTDLEWANKINSPIGAYMPDHEYLPPELNQTREGIWTAACDIWQFGKMLLIWGPRGEFSDDYLRAQSAERPERRLSASQSLCHNFFALQEEETTLA
jgi:hypothetical protein